MALQRWEYRWEDIGLSQQHLKTVVVGSAMTPISMEALNRLGADGWEAVSVTSGSVNAFCVLLKRLVN